MQDIKLETIDNNALSTVAGGAQVAPVPQGTPSWGFQRAAEVGRNWSSQAWNDSPRPLAPVGWVLSGIVGGLTGFFGIDGSPSKK